MALAPEATRVARIYRAVERGLVSPSDAARLLVDEPSLARQALLVGLLCGLAFGFIAGCCLR